MEPAFPLHDPQQGWITATFLDGSTHLIDLTTALARAHHITHVDAGHPAATAALYRILVTIALALLPDAPHNARRWRRWRLEQLNAGCFTQTAVENYFNTYKDRFYLIHPVFPFLQDPTLTLTHTTPAYHDTGTVDRAKYAKGLSPVEQAHPLSPSTNTTGGELTPWGLWATNSYQQCVNDAERTNYLFVTLMLARYSHTSIRVRKRSFLDSEQEADDYLPIAALRCATHFIPKMGNLYQSLLVSIEYTDTSTFTGDDLPEWEWEVNPATGFAGLHGTHTRWYDRVASLSSPRSAVNMSHTAILFTPPHNGDTNKHVGLCRRAAFPFRHHTTTNHKGKTTRLPAPLAWNPYIAPTQSGSVLRQSEGISDRTALENTTIYRVALLPPTEKIATPTAITTMRSPDIEKACGKNMNVDIHIHSGSITQDKTYNTFTITASNPNPNPVEAGIIDQWLTMGTRTWAILSSHVTTITNNTLSLTSLSHAFWLEYGRLFDEAREQSTPAPVGEYSADIMDLTRRLYRDHTTHFARSNPTTVLTGENIVLGSMFNWLKQQTGGEHARM